MSRIIAMLRRPARPTPATGRAVMLGSLLYGLWS